MPRKPDEVPAEHAILLTQKLEAGAAETLTLKDLRKAAHQTQKDLAEAWGVGQDTISRLEKRNDMLLSTLQHYVESIGGKLELVVSCPDRPAVTIDRIADEKPPPENGSAGSGPHD
jgi:DNA-binding XRE family transcriptional regulator